MQNGGDEAITHHSPYILSVCEGGICMLYPEKTNSFNINKPRGELRGVVCLLF